MNLKTTKGKTERDHQKNGGKKQGEINNVIPVDHPDQVTCDQDKQEDDPADGLVSL